MNAYMSIAVDDPDSPGGINHSGWILLVDKRDTFVLIVLEQMKRNRPIN